MTRTERKEDAVLARNAILDSIPDGTRMAESVFAERMMMPYGTVTSWASSTVQRLTRVDGAVVIDEKARAEIAGYRSPLRLDIYPPEKEPEVEFELAGDGTQAELPMIEVPVSDLKRVPGEDLLAEVDRRLKIAAKTAETLERLREVL